MKKLVILTLSVLAALSFSGMSTAYAKGEGPLLNFPEGAVTDSKLFNSTMKEYVNQIRELPQIIVLNANGKTRRFYTDMVVDSICFPNVYFLINGKWYYDVHGVWDAASSIQRMQMSKGISEDMAGEIMQSCAPINAQKVAELPYAFIAYNTYDEEPHECIVL